MDTYNPIGEKVAITKKGFLGGVNLPERKPGTAFVFCNNSGFYYSETEMTKAQIRKSGYHSVYLVDVSPKTVEMDVSCPCKNAGYTYHVKIKMKCCVSDPVIILNQNVTDMKEYLEVQIQEWAGKIIVQYDELQYDDVRRALNNELENLKFDAEENGVRVINVSLTVEQDQSVTQRIKNLDEKEYEHMVKRRLEELKRGTAGEKARTISEVRAIAKNEFGETPEALLWVDKLLEQSSEQEVFSQNLQNQEDRVAGMLGVIERLSNMQGVGQEDISKALNQLLNGAGMNGNVLGDGTQAAKTPAAPEDLFDDEDDEDDTDE